MFVFQTDGNHLGEVVSNGNWTDVYQSEHLHTHQSVLTVRDDTLCDARPNAPPESAIQGAELERNGQVLVVLVRLAMVDGANRRQTETHRGLCVSLISPLRPPPYLDWDGASGWDKCLLSLGWRLRLGRAAVELLEQGLRHQAAPERRPGRSSPRPWLSGKEEEE